MSLNIQSILIVDDLSHCRTWLQRACLLAFPDARIELADSLAHAVVKLAELDRKPDLALVDLDLGDGNGLEFLPILKRQAPSVYTVISTIFDDDAHLFACLRAGIDGYVLKQEPLDVLATMLRDIAEDQPPLSASISRRVLRYFSTQAKAQTPALPTGVDHLTERETHVLQLTGKGFSVPQVAELLKLSRHTIAGYVKEIYRKLGISSRAEAALEATRRGLT